MDGVSDDVVKLADATRELCILEAGTHRGSRGGKPADIEFTEADLAEIARNTEAVRQYLKPPLKLGHDDNQILAGQSDGDPALGWVASLRADGRKLYATLTNIPARLMELIAKGRYRTMSSEVSYWEGTAWEKNVKTGVKGKVLTGLALLGADLPAVSTLDDLATLLASDTGQPIVVEGPQTTATFAVVIATDGAKPLPRMTLAVADTKKCPNCGAEMSADATSCPKCGAAMACKEKTATMADTDATITVKVDAAEAEAKLTELTAKFTAQADRIAQLEAAAEAAEKRAAEAALKQTKSEAAAYVLSQANQDCVRLTNETSRELLTTLYVQLAKAEPIGPAESVTLKLSTKEGGEVVPVLDVLKRFVESLPDQKVLMTQQARTGAEKPGDKSDVDEALRPVAEKHKLNLSNPKERKQAIEIFSKMTPADREAVKDLGVTRAGE